MQLVVRSMLESDPKKTDLESWLLNQREVVSIVGSRATSHVESRVSVAKTPDQLAYSRYSIVLSGTNGEALVVVIALDGRGGYRIDSIKPL
jgi:hypothetical protein